MMKASKLFTLDTELIEELQKTPNASKLINDLLTDYFCKNSSMHKAEIKTNIFKNKQESDRLLKLNDNLSDDLKAIIDREVRILAVTKDIPKEILQDFEAFPNMTETILYDRFKEIYKPKYDIKFLNVLKAWKEAKNE